jgi:hypothetical protein
MTTGTPARLSLNGQECPFYGKFLTAARLTQETLVHLVLSKGSLSDSRIYQPRLEQAHV